MTGPVCDPQAAIVPGAQQASIAERQQIGREIGVACDFVPLPLRRAAVDQNASVLACAAEAPAPAARLKAPAAFADRPIATAESPDALAKLPPATE